MVAIPYVNISRLETTHASIVFVKLSGIIFLWIGASAGDLCVVSVHSADKQKLTL